ncbi:MAG: hypothetical protein JW940_04865 [Polyangiaceae bacterium]|nr:hypothetical protein [Polyangiaceae bacterium]
MDRFGTDEAGFSVEYDADTRMVRVEAWGFWNVEVASSFGPVVRDACRGRPRGTTLRLDMSRLRPMRDEGQRSFGSLMGWASGLGIQETLILTGSELVKLQLLRLVADSGARERTRFT